MKRLTKIVVGIIFSMLVACGGDGFLDSIDANRYAKDLNQLPVPTYIAQMTAGQKQVISEDVSWMIQYFDDKTSKQLAVTSISSTDVLARMIDLAKTKHVVQIDLAAIYADAQKYHWVPTQITAVLERVLQKKHTENAVFFMVDTKEAPVDWEVIKAYQVVVEVDRSAVVKDVPYKFFRHSDSVTREELEAEKKIAGNKFLSLEELNKKLAGLNDADAFDVQTQASIQKLEKKDLFLVRVLKENNYKMLSFEYIKNLRVSSNNNEFGCQDDAGVECLYGFAKENDLIRFSEKI